MTHAYTVRGIRLVVFVRPGTDLRYYCFNSNLTIDDPSLPKFRELSVYDKVMVNDCGVPRGTYTDAVRKLSITSFHHLTLFFVTCSNDTGLSAQHFDGNDTFHTLQIDCETSYTSLDLRFLDSLPDLKNLTVENVIMPPLPAHNKLTFVTISTGSPRSVGQPWGGCSELEDLIIMDWKINFLPDRWLANCQKLITIQMLRLTELYRLPAQMFSSPSLSAIVISECHVNSLPADLAAGAVNLTVLDVSNNYIEKLNHLFEAEQMLHLQYLDVSVNLVSAMSLGLLSRLQSLLALRVDGADQAHRCRVNWSHYGEIFPWPVLSSLTELSLRYSDARAICPEWGEAMPSLQLLNLTHTPITALQYSDIELLRYKNWEVDLRRNTDLAIMYSRDDFEKVMLDQNTTSAKLWLDTPYSCNCSWYWFARILQEKPQYIKLPEFECFVPESTATVPLHYMTYDTLVCETS
ncbi:uncharacterized protein LOC101744654 isoform X2 [Bombyx mori]|uniref:Uncharacterized protein n=2 Tax=Bombyx mori TaxID=7091 RepID=A0A8R2HQ93_BOMMO|nr:uncharacterized protein LOC101744654 [Bombyx mori]